jgi:hypothetical protein
MRNLDVWYTRLDVAAILERWEGAVRSKEVRRFERNVAKARTKDSLRAFAKLTHRVEGALRIVSDPPVIVPVEELLSGEEGDQAEQRPRDILASYRATLDEERRHLVDGYRYVHAARKVVGVGSVGTRAWIVLLVGRDEQDPLFLQDSPTRASASCAASD